MHLPLRHSIFSISVNSDTTIIIAMKSDPNYHTKGICLEDQSDQLHQVDLEQNLKTQYFKYLHCTSISATFVILDYLGRTISNTRAW